MCTRPTLGSSLGSSGSLACDGRARLGPTGLGGGLLSMASGESGRKLRPPDTGDSLVLPELRPQDRDDSGSTRVGREGYVVIDQYLPLWWQRGEYVEVPLESYVAQRRAVQERDQGVTCRVPWCTLHPWPDGKPKDKAKAAKARRRALGTAGQGLRRKGSGGGHQGAETTVPGGAASDSEDGRLFPRGDDPSDFD